MYQYYWYPDNMKEPTVLQISMKRLLIKDKSNSCQRINTKHMLVEPINPPKPKLSVCAGGGGRKERNQAQVAFSFSRDCDVNESIRWVML